MQRIQKLRPISDQAVQELSEYLDATPDEATTVNSRKRQFIFETVADDTAMIVKVYQHRSFPHRVASALNRGNADRYARVCAHLAARGVTVPAPVLVVKSGSGLLPDCTLFVMTRLAGKMLLDELPKIEDDPERVLRLASGICLLFDSLRQARIVHRDLSTKNILISDADELMLIDFDSSRAHRGTDSAFQRKHQRDIENFTSTCGRSPRLAEAVITGLHRNISPE